MNRVTRLISVGLHRDKRGTVQDVNLFELAGVDLFCAIYSTDKCLRGWVRNRRHWEWLFDETGRLTAALAAQDSWASPSRGLKRQFSRLCAARPEVL